MLSTYTNDDLTLITGEKTVKLGFNEKDGCFEKSSNESIYFTSNLTYGCEQKSTDSIVTDVSIMKK